MRIVSLVPHATELLFALGLGDQVVAVTHECDHPASVTRLPSVTRDVLPTGLNAGQIDAAVRARTAQGEAIYELDEELLHDFMPDLIVTQALCPVCAVSYDDVVAIAERIDSEPKVIALDPKTFGETLGDVRTLAQATGAKEAAFVHIARTAKRVDALKLAVRNAPRPRVVALEWLNPIYIAGHWTPQLIEMAGGEDVLGFPAENSERCSWETVAAAQPDVVVCMPCGYDLDRAHEEAVLYADRLRTLGAKRVVAVDASATFSRPGPRLIDGAELLGHVFHPDLVPEARAWARDVEGATA